MRIRYLRVAIALCTALVNAANPTSTTTAPSYVISLDRPVRKGHKSVAEIIMAGVYDSTRRWAGREPTTSQVVRGVHLIGEGEVLEVDATGHSSKDAVTVRSCTRLDGDHERELIAA